MIFIKKPEPTEKAAASAMPIPAFGHNQHLVFTYQRTEDSSGNKEESLQLSKKSKQGHKNYLGQF